MMKMNNQDDCCLYNNVFNYQYGLLSSQFVPALLWMETPLLSSGNSCQHFAASLLSYQQHQSCWPHWQSRKKKNQTKTLRQKETKEGMWDHRAGETNQGKENRQVLSKPAQVHYHFMWAGPETLSSLLGFRGRSCLPPSPFPSLCGTPKKQAKPPEPPGVGQGAGWQFGTDFLLCWSFPRASCGSWVSSRFYFHISAEYLTLLIFFQL